VCLVADYGDATVIRADDGTLTVTRADPIIGVSVALLAELSPEHITPDGLLQLDTAGQYRYRPVRLAGDASSTETARVVVFERVRGGVTL